MESGGVLRQANFSVTTNYTTTTAIATTTTTTTTTTASTTRSLTTATIYCYKECKFNSYCYCYY